MLRRRAMSHFFSILVMLGNGPWAIIANRTRRSYTLRHTLLLQMHDLGTLLLVAFSYPVAIAPPVS
jgi:hypothetical protein